MQDVSADGGISGQLRKRHGACHDTRRTVRLKGVMGALAARKESARTTYRVLLVASDPGSREDTARLLAREGHDVLCAASGQEALALLDQVAAHTMLVDHLLSDMTGPELIEQARVRNDLVQIILQTSAPSALPPRELLRTLSIQGYHDRGEGPERLLQWIDLAGRAFTVLERTRRSEHLKAQLVANVSHELRTPLNVILGYIELMREGSCGSQTPEGAEALITIHRQALILLHLINDLLDMSKLQAGAMQLARDRVSVSTIVDEFRDALPILLGSAEVSLRWDVPPGLFAMGDPGKVRVIVQNLISNAAKFTVKGEIAIIVQREGSTVYVTVEDTGPGIRPEDQAHIFELFAQAEPTDGRRPGGTGIGLHLARALARLMGGDLTVQSVVGEGSAFTLQLPAAES